MIHITQIVEIVFTALSMIFYFHIPTQKLNLSKAMTTWFNMLKLKFTVIFVKVKVILNLITRYVKMEFLSTMQYSKILGILCCGAS